jgi:hypothetical protein
MGCLLAGMTGSAGAVVVEVHVDGTVGELGEHTFGVRGSRLVGHLL